jgi:hypothetical protein
VTLEASRPEWPRRPGKTARGRMSLEERRARRKERLLRLRAELREDIIARKRAKAAERLPAGWGVTVGPHGPIGQGVTLSFQGAVTLSRLRRNQLRGKYGSGMDADEIRAILRAEDARKRRER